MSQHPTSEPDIPGFKASAMPRGRVLVVDDERVNRAILSQFLTTKGYASIEAANGNEALRIIAEEPVDLVLLDIVMPDMTGFEVLEIVREQRTESELPVIMVTADDDRKQIVRAFRSGANDYITKPVDCEVTIARIETHLKLKRAQTALQASEERYALSALGSNDGLWDWRVTEGDVYYSPRWKSMLGLEDDPSIDSIADWLDRIHDEDQQRVQCELQSHLRGEIPHFETQLRMRHENGDYRWMLCRGTAVRDENERATRIAGSLTDITEGKVADALTGLPNRLLFRDRLERTVERNKRKEVENFAVFFIDLDNFKQVNDNHGHEAGDQLLVAVARRLEGCVRSSDAVVARMGGDEFTVLLEKIESQAVAEEIAERILDSFAAPFTIGNGREIFASASIGISSCSTGTLDVDDLMRGADTAMYEAKAQGRSGFQVYNPQLQQRQHAKQDMEHELQQAIDRNEIFLHFQPIVEMGTGRLCALEALARWNHPDLGTVSPTQLVEIADTGMIAQIGRSTLQMACEQLAEWRGRYEACETIRVDVNIDSLQFTQPRLTDDIIDILNASGLDPNALTLEFTETTMMESPNDAKRCLQKLRGSGIRVSMDEFGTGNSSLSSLHQLPLDALKVDRSFVDNMLRSSENTAIVRAILSLADNLGLEVVAEGIETNEQRTELLAMGCEFGQGFFYSRPLDTSDVEEILRNSYGGEIHFAESALLTS